MALLKRANVAAQTGRVKRTVCDRRARSAISWASKAAARSEHRSSHEGEGALAEKLSAQHLGARLCVLSEGTKEDGRGAKV